MKEKEIKLFEEFNPLNVFITMSIIDEFQCNNQNIELESIWKLMPKNNELKEIIVGSSGIIKV